MRDPLDEENEINLDDEVRAIQARKDGQIWFLMSPENERRFELLKADDRFHVAKSDDSPRVTVRLAPSPGSVPGTWDQWELGQSRWKS